MKTKILMEQTKIRKYQKLLNGNYYIRNKNHLKNKIHKSYRRIHNIVKEMHNKTAIFLCSNYKRILLPEFRVKDILQNIGISKAKQLENPLIRARINKLNKRVKFVLLNLSHYRFRQHLANKCVEYGCQLEIVNEAYTSQCCTNCGILGKTYINRIKYCSNCQYEINRDVNGARNIFLKNYNLFIKAIR